MEKCGKVVGWKTNQETAEPAAVRTEESRVGSRPLGLRACSACAGDYEDPDRTAWTPDSSEDEGGDYEPRVTTEEFPAEE